MKTLAVALFLALCAPAALAAETVTATVGTAHGTVPLALELALTPPSREHGLMDRKTLAPDDGMLFVFPQTKPIAFWMKNTLIPLDMLFIDANGKIVHIAQQATPLSETPIDSTAPTKSVIELAGGRAAEAGIAVGDHVAYQLPAGAHVE